VSFSEQEPTLLRLDAEPFEPGLTPRERRTETVAMASVLARNWFGEATAERFGLAVAPWSAWEPQRFGAFFGAAIGASGPVEATVYLELPHCGDQLPPAGSKLLHLAHAAIPGLMPHMHAVAVRMSGVTERLSLVCSDWWHLFDLAPLLDRLGLSDRLPILLDTTLPLNGGCFALPPGAAIIGLRRTAAGAELKLELLVPPLPVDAAVIGCLLAARPTSAIAYRHWLAAVAAPRHRGPPNPGAINIVSVRVSPGTCPELNVYLRPTKLFQLCCDEMA
jgi:hypothetical protein